MPHIIIIGGGVIGLSCADRLLQDNVSVTLIEQDQIAGRGAAQYNSGMIHPSQAFLWDNNRDPDVGQSVLALARLSKILLEARYQQLLGQTISTKSHEQVGCLQLFDTKLGIQNVKDQCELFGVRAENYSGSWSFGKNALFFPDDKFGDAFAYMQALSMDLALRGCHILTGQAAVPVVSQNICSGIRLHNGDFLGADHVIIAAGVASTTILKALKVNLPVQPVKGHALLFDRPSSLSDLKLPHIPIMHWESRSALTVFDDHVRLSGTIDAPSPDQLLTIWRHIAPDILEFLGSPFLQWSAQRPTSILGRPFIGETSIKRIWVNSGHGHMGWTLSAASGALMADMILGGYQSSVFALPAI